MNSTRKVLISTFNMYKGGSLSIYESIKNIIATEDNIYEFGCSSFCNAKNRKRQILVKYPLGKFNFLYRIIIEQVCIPIIALWCRTSKIVMLGNFPVLFWFGEQNVFFHNVLYLRPPERKNGFKFLLEASFFKFAIKLKKPKLLIQTANIQKELIDVFGASINTRIVGAAQQVLSEEKIKTKKIETEKVQLFYPAFLYPHKNHELLFRTREWLIENNIIIYLTIEKLPSDIDVENSPFICVGGLSKLGVNEYYNLSDGLLFPSLEESLGLPLLEAVEFNLPIIATDLPYVKAAIDDYYSFDSLSDASFKSAMRAFCIDVKQNNSLLPTSKILKTKKDFFKGLVE